MFIEPDETTYWNQLDSMLECSNILKYNIKPLEKSLGVSNGFYILIYEDGHQHYLTSIPQFFEDTAEAYLQMGQRYTVLDTLLELPYWGNFLTASEPNLQRLKQNDSVQMFYDIAHNHQINFELLSTDYIDTPRGRALRVVSYSSKHSRSNVNNIYLNSIQQINQMSNFISDMLSETLQNLPTITPTHRERQLVQKCFTRKEITQNNIQSVMPKQYISSIGQLKKNKIKITQREKDVMYWYILGKSASETGIILNISAGTVRTYFNRLKEKFNCFYKHQLVIKFIEHGYINEYDFKNFI